MYAPTHVEVSLSGEIVILQIGNIERSMEFDKALKLSAQMMEAGRLARRIAGDDARRHIAAGSLHDASAEKTTFSRFNRSLPPREHDVGARPVGTLVQVRLGADRFDMDYRAAAQIAQWLRVRGKEARNAAGETAHWSKIANAAEAAARLQ